MTTFKGSVISIEKEFLIRKIGTLTDSDRKNLDRMIETIC
jgi:hypothetical protein